MLTKSSDISDVSSIFETSKTFITTNLLALVATCARVLHAILQVAQLVEARSQEALQMVVQVGPAGIARCSVKAPAN